MLSDPIIYVVDDDEAVRDSLEVLLRATGYVVRSYASGQEFLDATEPISRGCLIIDIRMPGMDGFELQSRLGRRQQVISVIVITGHGDIPMAVRAMRAGAVDFVEKPFSEDAILGSVRLGVSMIGHQRSVVPPDTATLALLATLSPREREVLDGLVAGQPNKAIAHDLNISPRTVEIHRARVMDKMKARSLPELVRLAFSVGIDPKPV